jgi:hypothetical protein
MRASAGASPKSAREVGDRDWKHLSVQSAYNAGQPPSDGENVSYTRHIAPHPYNGLRAGNYRAAKNSTARGRSAY